MDLAIPELNNSRDAIAFGQVMTRDQYLFLWGMRTALQQTLSEMKVHRVNGSASEHELSLAFKIQFYREAMDNARPIILASIIELKRESDGKLEPIAAEYMAPVVGFVPSKPSTGV